MTAAIKRRGRAMAPFLLVGFLALLSIGTITNQLKINAANSKLAIQASNGQKSLVRTCRLLPVAQKMYGDALQRGVITVTDYRLVFSTAVQACGPKP